MAGALASDYAASAPADYDFLVKTVIVGESGVGKSALMRRFARNEYSEHFIATIGVDFEIRHVDVDGKRAKLQLWDTAGQERFRSITAAYYRGAGIIVIVFDVTCDESFAAVQPWIKEVRQYNADAPLMLVANKCDLTTKRVVSKEAVAALSEQLGVPCVETSAKSATNVDAAFLHRVREFIHERAHKLADTSASAASGKVALDKSVSVGTKDGAGAISCCK